MNPSDLLDQALHLARRARGKPKRADLCRAQIDTLSEVKRRELALFLLYKLE